VKNPNTKLVVRLIFSTRKVLYIFPTKKGFFKFDPYGGENGFKVPKSYTAIVFFTLKSHLFSPHGGQRTVWDLLSNLG